MRYTEADFEQLSWHDCAVWNMEIRAGDPDEQDWTSDLAFHIDYIVQWLCGVDGNAQFLVAPALLVFHGVTSPRIQVAWEDTELQAALHPLAIDRIERSRVENQKVYLDRPYYLWQILLNWPQGGEIAFGAVGFTQTLLAEPLLIDKQHLTLRQRSNVTAH